MVIGIIGMVLIALSSFLPQKSSDAVKVSGNSEITATEYEEKVEKELLEIVKEISGDKKPKVFVTLETGIRREYAGETKDSASQRTDGQTNEESVEGQVKTITVKTSDGSEDAITVIEYMPQIRGVAIVCNGADNEAVRQKIVSAVTAALNITSKRVSVTGGQTQ